MTLRRFMVLVRGLGPNSATTTRLQARRYMGAQSVREVSTPEEARSALSAIFPPPKARVS
jgi:hypothetical protein